jgi:hypothetical protein
MNKRDLALKKRTIGYVYVQWPVTSTSLAPSTVCNTDKAPALSDLQPHGTLHNKEGHNKEGERKQRINEQDVKKKEGKKNQQISDRLVSEIEMVARPLHNRMHHLSKDTPLHSMMHHLQQRHTTSQHDASLTAKAHHSMMHHLQQRHTTA